MGQVGDLDTNTVVSVLTQGLEFATELKKQLNPAAASKQMCDSLLDKVLSSYDNALKLLDCVALLGDGEPSTQTFFHSPVAVGGEGLDHTSMDKGRKDGSKKRKTLPKWSEQVKVGTGTIGFEGQLDDGYNWRKYGQKNILGCNNPRAYYRCTHRNTQGCLATKQVQRTDEDPSVYEISYRGKHSCMQEKIKEDKKEGDEMERESQNMMIALYQECNTNVPFAFPSTQSQIEYENMGTSCYSSPFLSPATSDSISYLSFSQCCNVNDFGIGERSESDSPAADNWDITIEDALNYII